MIIRRDGVTAEQVPFTSIHEVRTRLLRGDIVSSDVHIARAVQELSQAGFPEKPTIVILGRNEAGWRAASVMATNPRYVVVPGTEALYEPNDGETLDVGAGATVDIILPDSVPGDRMVHGGRMVRVWVAKARMLAASTAYMEVPGTRNVRTVVTAQLLCSGQARVLGVREAPPLRIV